MLVYGVLLMVVGATATGLAALVSANAQTTILNSTVNTDAALVRSFVNLAALRPADLDPSQLSPDRATTLRSGLTLLTDSGQLVRIALLTPDGALLVGSGDDTGVAAGAGLQSAVQDHAVIAEITGRPDAATPATAGVETVVREYVPVLLNGSVVAVVEIWRDAAPILAQLEQARISVVLVILSGALVCAVMLFLLFRSAQGRLTRQAHQLLEAARHDSLTGALNHGAIVDALEAAVRSAREKRSAVGLAIVDIDSFGLLNETYGHEAGDEVLKAIHDLLVGWLPPQATLGRYGADEFLVVAAGRDSLGLRQAMESARSETEDLAFTFGTSERLPVNISAGLCHFPIHGEAVTSLLAVAALSLEEAKVSGGDSVRVAASDPESSRFVRTFDVYQGLVIAIDTKDHYTRRHSEDVAQYADFMAELLELDPDTRQALHTAGLLHDIGKIGIPDAILRKPGRLTADETEIVRQHVVLGDLIVRDLPGLPIVRAGIRGHHERWDGKGYIDGLAGEEIPLVARILAVADAFSAMTATRTYRKALSVDEAIARLGDAAGSQLDERLVSVFIDGYRSASHPPVPGMRRVPASNAVRTDAA
jgi:diguanylate cyclase (GGDEF)-like protein